MYQTSQSHTYFFLNRPEKYPRVKKSIRAQRKKLPQDCWNYGTLHISQLVGLSQSVGSIRTYVKRKTANKVVRLQMTCDDCRSNLYFYQYKVKSIEL